MTLLYLPPAERGGRIADLFVEGRAAEGLDGRTELAGFIERSDRFLASVAASMPKAAWRDDGETVLTLTGFPDVPASKSGAWSGVVISG